MKRALSVFVIMMLVAMGLAGCGTPAEPAPAADDTGSQVQVDSEQGGQDAPQAPAGVAYQNIHFDDSAEIAAHNAKNSAYTTPDPLEIAIAAADATGATGVQLVASSDPENTTDYYLNALVAGNELLITGDIVSAVSTNADTQIEVGDGTVTLVPAVLSAANPVDEQITVTTGDGEQSVIHTLNEYMCSFDIETNGEVEAGVYTFAIDKFLLRVNTDGEIVYYRNMGCIGHQMAENFKAQDTGDGRFYTYYMELDTDRRNVNGGYSSGLYVVMDNEYREMDYITLLANDDPNHTHGEGYLDQHEFLMLSADHYIALSYTPVKVGNLEGIGIDGGNEAYVHAGIIQEVRGGEIVQEINTVDYSLFYAGAMEANDYAASTDQGSADDFMDYVHINSVSVDPKDNNLIVSMRHQYAVYKFDRETGEILWILGGKDNQFSGLDDLMDADGNLFVGQHDAKYVNASVAGNDSTITVFDNHTSFQENLTRTIEFVLDESARTATATVIQGSDLDAITGKNHWATHCACVEHRSDKSVLIGWGLHAIFDNNPETARTHPVFSDYNPLTETVTFELCVSRNPLLAGEEEPCFSYRTYKNEF